jgi:hypothetical protein
LRIDGRTEVHSEIPTIVRGRGLRYKSLIWPYGIQSCESPSRSLQI